MSCESSIADLTMEMFEDDCREQLVSHINEVTTIIQQMKSAFTTAQLQLESVHVEDRALRDEMNQTKNQCQQQSAEILRLILSLKSEVSSLKEVMQTTQLIQHGLQSTVQSLVMERDILLDELAKNGAISEAVRGRLRSRGSGFGRPSSGSQSTNDSGVALLLEKAHAAFNEVSNNHFGLSSVGLLFRDDHDSLPGDHQPHAMSHHVHEYLSGLTPNHLQHHNTDPSGFSSFNTDTGPGASYDSDSSLTLAATKSLSLSNSLSKQCGLELDQEDEKYRTRLAREESDSDSLPTTQVKGVTQNSIEKEMGNNAEFYKSTSTSDGDELILQTKIQNNIEEQELEFIEEQEQPVNFKESQRLRVAKELIETERKYCHTLKTIQDTFAQPLKNSGILTMKDINILFPEEVFDLYDKHCGLLGKLEERISTWNKNSTVGDLLEEFTNAEGSDVLRLYTSYVNDFDSCLNTFHKLCRNSSDFTRFLKTCLEHPTCGGLDLGSFLLTPVQRMPRYILLLKQMIKFTEPTHQDFKNINKCLERLRDYLKRLNDSMEHSFQLVTAQMIPQSQEGTSSGSSGGEGFTNQNNLSRTSASSHSSGSGIISTGEEIIHKIRYKRSTSVPRNQKETDGTSKVKLKSRSKSDWAVCKSNGIQQQQPQHCHSCSCNCNNNGSNPDASSGGQHAGLKNGRYMYPSSCLKKHSVLPLERAMSDSDMNSDVEDNSLNHHKSTRKFTTSKSLHDFKRDSECIDWNMSEQSLCDSENLKCLPQQNGKDTMLRNNFLIRPLTSSTTSAGRYVARIIAERGSEPELNKNGKSLQGGGGGGGGGDKNNKKRTSIRASLKNIFSLKKRNSRSVEISQPIPPSLNGNSYSMNFSTFMTDGHRQLGQSRESVVMINYEPSISPTGCNKLSTPTQKSQRSIHTHISPIPPKLSLRTHGAHYIDEEGKPCTNV